MEYTGEQRRHEATVGNDHPSSSYSRKYWRLQLDAFVARELLPGSV